MATASLFSVNGYVTFPADECKGKVRLLILVRSTLAVRANAMVCKTIHNSTMGISLWIELRISSRSVIIGGVYRPWVGLSAEREHLAALTTQLKAATTAFKSVLVCGDLNLDQHRHNDKNYSRVKLLQALMDGVEEAGLEYYPTSPTWHSHGVFGNAHKKSCLDHVYACGLDVAVTVLPDSTTDHRPLLASVQIRPPVAQTRQQSECRNFSKLDKSNLLEALEEWDWSAIYAINDVEAAHKFLVDGITAALEKAAPLKKSNPNVRDDLYLRKDTLEAMARRDAATSLPLYRSLRNKVTSLVRRDKLQTNLEKLRKAKGDPKVVWKLANQALGKVKCTPLPASLVMNGSPTQGNTEAASAMNAFYIEKINKLRSKLPSDSPTLPSSPPTKEKFEFSFACAGRISKIIKSLSNTTALGNDGIPTCVLKLGVDCLAGPVSHLINRSLADGHVPTGFKQGRIIPVFKGKGKSVTDPASYRPVSLLPALSKVLEIVVKEDLEKFLKDTGGLPNSQFGFRPRRSTTAAIATAHGHWLKATQGGETVAILAFDFSSAFDTVDPATLITKLQSLGVRGNRELAWFRSYMTGGCQVVDWNGTRSGPSEVKYGVRQGSILGPLLFLTLMADLPTALRIENNSVVGYADDVCLWTSGKDHTLIRAELDRLAMAFVNFSNNNALALNPDKTQLLLAGSNVATAKKNITVKVGEAVICPSSTLDLLGVSFDSSLSSAPYSSMMAAAARQRAALIARLGAHLPRGHYLQQLANGLVMGKLGYAAAAMGSVRLVESDPVPDATKSIQVAINDVARTLTGSTRSDRLRIPDLLKKAGLPMYNRMVVKAVALETWKAFHSSDGPNGDRNPLGLLMFGSRNDCGPSTVTRAGSAGKIRPVTTKRCLASDGVSVWNHSRELRAAPSYSAAIRAAKNLAQNVPL